MDTFDDEASRQALSALADGELDAVAGASACQAWHRDAAARRDWHAWHLIGDVLRSEDLASDPARDVRFCAALRVRLASEPVVLSPAPLLPRGVGAGLAAGRPSRWMVPSAVAAGMFLAVGTFVALRPGEPPAAAQVARGVAAAPVTAVAAAPESETLVTVRRDSVVPPVAVVADSRMIRDAQLDRYLVAHKQFAGTSALGVPSVFLRSATVDVPAREAASR